MDLSSLKNISTDSDYASGYHKRIIEMINGFEKELDQEHEVGARLVSFGQTFQFHITNVGYYNPSLIRFYGETEKGEKVELIQHVTQISFLLMAVEKQNPDLPARRIGFEVEVTETK